jgi:hypothetical protein
MSSVTRWLLEHIERFLSALAGPDAAEAMLGDVLESGDAPPDPGRAVGEILGSLPPMIAARIRTSLARREVDRPMDTWSRTQRRAAAIVGILACLPAALLVTGGILQMFFGSPSVLGWLERTIHNEQIPLVAFLRQPATVLGGLMLAGALNLLPLVRLALSRQEGSFVGTVRVRMRSGHLAIGSLAAVLMAVLLGYGFSENYVVTPRASAAQATMPVLVTNGKSDWRSDVRVYVPNRVSCEAQWTLIPVRLVDQDPVQSPAGDSLRFVRLIGSEEGCAWEPAWP